MPCKFLHAWSALLVPDRNPTDPRPRYCTSELETLRCGEWQPVVHNSSNNATQVEHKHTHTHTHTQSGHLRRGKGFSPSSNAYPCRKVKPQKVTHLISKHVA